MAEILVTGAAGFIGSHFVDELVRDGHNVCGVDNFITSAPANISHLDDEPLFRFIETDITKGLEFPGALDYIANLASPASPVDYYEYPLETMLAGSEGAYHCLELAREKKAVFLQASTSEVYGDPDVTPQAEDYWGRVNAFGPRACYDEAKRFAEALAYTYRSKGWAEIRIARIFNTFGPRMRKHDGRVVPNFINQALEGEPVTVYGDGSQTRSFCYINDLVEGLARLLFSPVTTPVNIGNPNEMTILDIAERIRKKVNPSSEIVFLPLPENDPKQRTPDISKAGKLLGWEPKWTLEDGLDKTIEYFRYCRPTV